MESQQLIVSVALVGWLVVCSWQDIQHRRLPNWLTLGACLLAVLGFVWTKQSLLGDSISSASTALLVALLLTLPAYAVRWLSAGDVKMLSALGLLTGLQFMLLSYAVAGITAGLIVLYSVLGQRYLPYLNLHLAKFERQLPAATLLTTRSLPFGALLAFGGVVMLTLHTTGTMNVVAAT